MARGSYDGDQSEASENDQTSHSRTFLKSLVEDNHASLIRFLRRRIGDVDDVNDLAQDLYCQIAQKSDTASIEQPRAYLFRAARNLIYSRARHRRFTNADGHFSIDDAPEADVTCSAPLPERAAQDRQQLALVARAMEDLSPKCRTAFVLVRFEDCTYKEAAARMGLSVKSIEYYMRQALTHIRDRVDAANAVEPPRQAAE